MTRNRRIDLLAIDKNANLVVIELKRTTDGGQTPKSSPSRTYAKPLPPNQTVPTRRHVPILGTFLLT